MQKLSTFSIAARCARRMSQRAAVLMAVCARYASPKLQGCVGEAVGQSDS
jgi:hypothetical protein